MRRYIWIARQNHIATNDFRYMVSIKKPVRLHLIHGECCWVAASPGRYVDDPVPVCAEALEAFLPKLYHLAPGEGPIRVSIKIGD